MSRTSQSQVVSLGPARVHHMSALPIKLSTSHHPFDSVNIYPSSPSFLPLTSPSSRSPSPPLLPIQPYPSYFLTPPTSPTKMFSNQSPSRSEYLLRETLLKDELQREKERGRDRDREREEQYLLHQPRRASLHRSYTESTLPIPRATSLSPTRRHHRGHRHQNHPFQHPHSESPYDQILRARLDKVLTSATAQRQGSDSPIVCHYGHASSSLSTSKRASLPATPHAGETGGAGWLGWFWREDADAETVEGSLGRGRGCESKWKNSMGHERNASSSESSGLLTPEDRSSTFAHVSACDARSSLNNIKSRARSHTAPTSPSLSLSPRPKAVKDTSFSSSSSSTHSCPKRSWVIPLETVYSGEDNVTVSGTGVAVPVGSGVGVGAEARGVTQYKNNEGQGEDGILTPPPTPPSPVFSRLSSSKSSKGREDGVGVGSKPNLSSNPRHRRTMSELPRHSQSQSQSHPQQFKAAQSDLESHFSTLTRRTSTHSTSSMKSRTKPKALSARDPEDDEGFGSGGSGSDSASPTSCRSLPLPLSLPASRLQRPQLPPRAHTQLQPWAQSSPSDVTFNATKTAPDNTPSSPRKFNVRTASAQCKQLEGYVSFMAVEGLGEPGPESEADGGLEESGGKKGKKSRWLLF
ncbi:hypothetical protein L218DRAFT_999236 [Marasmius fiardii PR-910]|nr:hypothetical protein L218DRAFT_999236 [Marasmius fiardii PR-910]